MSTQGAEAAAGPDAERTGPAPGSIAAVVPGRDTRGSSEPDATRLDDPELRQLRVLRRLGTTGALLIAAGSVSSYGAANPIPNPVDGLRIIGLLSRIGPASLAVSYAGIGLVVVAWFLLGRLTTPGRVRRLTRSQLTHTLAMWAVPFLLTPPLFSRDVYAYLAVGKMMQLGFNPYDSGPLDVLGDGDAFAHQVDARWQRTPTPYGPAFLLITRAIVGVTGSHVIVAVLLQRLVELVGVALIVWAVPRLARRLRLDPISALWLGALNPLVLFHLVAGGHNEALMIGMMMAGLVIALDRSVILGTVLLTGAVGVKATAGLALAFLVVALALRAGGTWRDLWRWGLRVGTVFVGTFAVLTLLAGVGVGWLAALNTPGLVRSFLSATTAVSVVTGAIGTLLGLGDQTGGVLDVMHPLGTIVGTVLAGYVWWRCWRHGFDPILGLGVAIGLFVILSPVVQPWYLLWAALPLAASTAVARYRNVTVAITVALSVMIMPSGSVIRPLIIAQAALAAALVAAGAWYLLRRKGLVPISEWDRWVLASTKLARRRHPSSAGRRSAPPAPDTSSPLPAEVPAPPRHHDPTGTNTPSRGHDI
ncbi:MAG: polyprenol phosphomannose-dependent alpha 1,6 mannosyltransferase MptB [Nakamurella sp.]